MYYYNTYFIGLPDKNEQKAFRRSTQKYTEPLF